MSKSVMMMKLKSNNDKKTLYVQDSDGDFIATPYTEEVEGYVADWNAGSITDEEFLNLIDMDLSSFANRISNTVNTRLQKLSERITTDGMHIYIDGDDFEKVQLDKALEDHMVRMLTTRNDSEADRRNWASFVAFTENLYNNTDPDVRVQIFSWMEAQGWLTLTEDGCIIGYKGCQKNEETGIAESINRGPGIVDGVIYNGNIPNPDGAIVEIAKSLVTKDPANGCASGLHVGTYNYARGFARDVILKVKMNPRDIISVPYDCNAQKVRCCRYEVLEHEDIERTWHDDWYDRVFGDDLSYGDDYDDYDDYDEYDDEYGYDEDDFCDDCEDCWRNDDDCECDEDASEQMKSLSEQFSANEEAIGATEPVSSFTGLNDYLTAIGQAPIETNEKSEENPFETDIEGHEDTVSDQIFAVIEEPGILDWNNVTQSTIDSIIKGIEECDGKDGRPDEVTALDFFNKVIDLGGGEAFKKSFFEDGGIGGYFKHNAPEHLERKEWLWLINETLKKFRRAELIGWVPVADNTSEVDENKDNISASDGNDENINDDGIGETENTQDEPKVSHSGFLGGFFSRNR